MTLQHRRSDPLAGRLAPVAEVSFWSKAGPVTDVGAWSSTVDTVPADPAAIREVVTHLVLHYRRGNPAQHGTAPERLAEVDLRSARAMLDRLCARGTGLGEAGSPDARVVGCCRDFAVLFLAIARHHQIPSRARVGFATYFLPGWLLDHVVVELFDAGVGRWRLIDPQIEDDFAPADGGRFDPLDVPRDRFLTGPKAWLEARAGVREPDRFVVDPGLEIPGTRSWRHLRRNLLHDLSSLRKNEMLLWDAWGLMDSPRSPRGEEPAVLDHLARLTADPLCPLENIADWAGRPGFAVPATVTSYSPAAEGPRRVEVSALLDDEIELD